MAPLFAEPEEAVLVFFWCRRERLPLDEEVDGCDDEEAGVSVVGRVSSPPEWLAPLVEDDDAVVLSSGAVSAVFFWVSS